MKNIIIEIFVCMLLIATVAPIVGSVNKTCIQDCKIESNKLNVGNINTATNDEYFNIQWSLHNTGQTGGIVDCDIDAPEAWSIETGDPDVVIAVIDSGIDYTHPDLEDKIWINEDEIADNGIDDDNNGYIDDMMGWNFLDDNNDPLDLNGHGTVCAGVLGADTNNNEGIAGVCWDCQIMPLKKSRGTGVHLHTIIEAIEYAADNGADIISMSFGTYTFHQSLKDAVDYAYNKGVFICASAGNEGTSAPRYPAAFENTTAVAATNDKDQKMTVYVPQFGIYLYSNHGPWVDVAAPGQEIFSTFPTYNSEASDFGFELDYDYLSGTSLACPHVAGLAGLLLSKNPYLSPDQIKALICDNGSVDPYNSTEDLGSGRINAYKALMFPDISCDESLSWTDVKPGDTVTGSFTVENIGENHTYLDWEITGEPDWGEWTFDPISGENLNPDDEPVVVQVSCVAPDEKNRNFKGLVKVENKLISSDICKIDVTLSTPKNRPFNFNFPILSWLFERFPNAFPILRYMLGL